MPGEEERELGEMRASFGGSKHRGRLVLSPQVKMELTSSFNLLNAAVWQIVVLLCKWVALDL
jgi:hypothetical protein